MVEFISRDWLMQNTNNGMTGMEVIQAIINAPVVEVDVDLLHDLETARGRRKNRVAWAVNTAVEIAGEGWTELVPQIIDRLLEVDA